MQAKAKELGISEDAVRRDLETRRLMDFSTPATQESHDKQTGIVNGLKRGFGLAGLAEPTRTLPDGTLLPHPELGSDRAKFDAAIEASSATPEAKAKARGLWDKYHDNYLTNARITLERMPKMPDAKDYLNMASPLAQLLPGTVTDQLPKVENYTAWRERLQEEGKLNDLTENQKAEKYMEEQKGRNGFVKLIDNIGSNLLAGSHDLVTAISRHRRTAHRQPDAVRIRRGKSRRGQPHHRRTAIHRQ